MSEKLKKKDRHRVEKKKWGGPIKSKGNKIRQAATTVFSLLANDQSLDPTLSSLFAVKQPPVKSKQTSTQRINDLPEGDDADEVEDIEPSEIHLNGSDGAGLDDEATLEGAEGKTKRKRKRKDDGDELEDAYMKRLAREEAKEADRIVTERLAKRSRSDMTADEESIEDGPADDDDQSSDVAGESEGDDLLEGESDDEDAGQVSSPPPRHETETAADEEFAQASRTVFLGNVSTEAISSKADRKTLLHHLGSFFEKLVTPKKGEAKHKVESIRFRSTPYASSIPKKAAFAKKELMDATTKSTNAYAVYSTAMLAREAVKRLNGSVVLNRHLRVDQVAHPAKVDHRRCVFIGNLGFVDDESNILKANEEEGREKRKQGKEPADIEEGLWRTFERCGVVESVRVIRDSTTRVGKGIAYVQFEDENAVEAALLYNDRKFPPMLPRKLRVTRAKAQKRNAKPGSDRPTSRVSANGYQRKITAEEASKAGRAGKLLGRAAAAARARTPAQRQGNKADGPTKAASAIQKPENFIFEGHRASAKQGKAGLKLGGRSNKNKVTKRSASFRSNKRKA